MPGNLSCNKQLIFLFFLIFSPAFYFLHASDSGTHEPEPWFVPVIRNVPADTTLACLNDLPEAPVLFALDGADTISGIMAVDFPAATSLDLCTGGSIQRVWTATGGDGSIARDTQVITILPDNTAPAMAIADVNETVACDLLGVFYPDWLNVQRTRAASLSSDCADITITDDAPAVFTGACESLVVTFTLSDPCGNASMWRATLNTLDTVAPVLSFVPADTVLSCLEQIPPPAEIVATDNCSATVNQSFQEISDQIANGSCTEYEYNIERLWTFSDDCGNTRVVRQRITIVDNSAPVFSVPSNVTVSCDSDWEDPSTTGQPGNIIDCDPDIEVTYTDVLEAGACPGNFRVRRIWTLSDTCGNLSSATQTITVVDNQKPTFLPPPDIVVDCGQEDNLDITGRPQQLTDNCTPSEDLTAVISAEIVIAGSCANSYTVRRTWELVDQCGNTTSHVQQVTVRDESAPEITAAAENLILDCLDGIDLSGVFNDWINNRGGAMATDNCSQNLNWTAINVNDGQAASLPAFNCPAGGDTLLFREVAFLVTDECNNTDTTFAAFVVLDNEAPVIDFCPEDVTLTPEPGTCTANFMVVPPLIRDACFIGITSQSFALEQAISSADPTANASEAPVNVLEYSFALNLSLPVNAASDAEVDIRLRNVDGAAPGEYFLVYGEDNTLIGRSALTDISCGSSDTTLVIPAALIDQWAVDKRIDLLLVPNVPEGLPGSAAINPVCTGAYVRTVLNLELQETPGISFAYQVDTETPVFVDPIAPTTVNLSAGRHTMTYLAIDCAGNLSSCSFEVVVEDREAPEIVCPADEVLSLPKDSCMYNYLLPFPEVSDNCSAFPATTLTYPADSSLAYLSYVFDASLNSYIAREKNFAISGVLPNAVGEVALSLELKGDFSTRDAVFNVTGENNTFIGTTNVGVADCNRKGTAVFSITANQYNDWAADGVLNITLQPRVIAVPPGVSGDGINPCNPNELDIQGRDKSSWVFVRLNYQSPDPQFFTRGATNLPVQRFSDAAFRPEIALEVGETEIFYLVEDMFGNADTCSFTLEVQDNQRPIARCKSTTVFISPSGLNQKALDASLLNAGSYDNCGIDTLIASPNNLNCSQIGAVILATLNVVDIHGNTNSCASAIRLEAEQPRPAANNGICGGDTLYLYANPPADGADGIFTYEWYNPAGQLISTEKNPVIPNASATQSGPYRVEIEGLTGCRSLGVVQVSIEPIPMVPSIQTREFICISDDIVLNASFVPAANNVTYYWYTGPAEAKTLIGTTTDPRFVAAGPHEIGKQEFYLQIEANGCISAISQVMEVTASEMPEAIVETASIDVCAGESIVLGTNVSGPGITYQWTGPNGFSSTRQFPSAISADLEDAGTYELVVLSNGCASAPDFTSVAVRPTPGKPLITNSGPICEGTPLSLNTNIADASIYTWIAPNLEEYATNENSLVLEDAGRGLSGDWRVYASLAGCDSEVSEATSVVVNALPSASAAVRESRVCEGRAIELEGGPLLEGASYEWIGPDGFVSGSQNALISNVSLDNEGTYILTVTNQAGCSDEASVNVSVLPGVRITAISNNAPACLEGPTDIRMVATTFPANDGTYSFSWSGPNGFASSDSIAIVPNALATSNGNYQLVVTNGNGCASLPGNTLVDVSDPLAIPSAPRLNTATLPPFCTGQDLILETGTYAGVDVFYNWLTPTGMVVTETPELNLEYITPDDGGNYSVYVSVDGCVSRTSVTTNIRVGEIPEVTVTAPAAVCSGGQIRLDASFINGATYLWTGPNDFNSTRYNPVINQADPTMSGDYIVTANLNGCVSEPAIGKITVAPTPEVPEIYTDPAICLDKPGSMLNFTIDIASATEGAFYSWYGPDGLIGNESSERDFALANLEFFSEGIYTFRARARLGNCYSAFSEPVQVTMNEFPDYQAFAGNDAQACSNIPFSLQADAPTTGTGSWTVVSPNAAGVRIENPTLPNSVVSGMQGGNLYTFKWTLSNGACGSYDSDEVVVEVISPELAEAGEDQIACIANEIRVNATPLALSTGTWIQSEAQRALGIRIADNSDPNSVITGMEPGNLYEFTWRAEGGCGTFEDKVYILISDPNPFAGVDQVACNDDQVATLIAKEPSSGSKGFWTSVDPEALILDPGQRETMVMGLSPGANAFVWTIDEGICGDLSRDTVIVDFYYLPKAVEDTYMVEFGSTTDLPVLENDFLPKAPTLSIVSLPANGTAQLLDDSTLSYTPAINFVGTDELIYEICSDACECSQAKVLLNIGIDAPCTPPSIITPNNDQVNDYFVVPCLLDNNNYPDNSLVIINRWGDEVFRSSGPYQNNWNGRYNGEDLPDGTYFYILDFGNNTRPISGFFEIKR